MKGKITTAPPKWPLKLLKFFIKENYLEEIEGDMEETFQDTLNTHTKKQAKFKYAIEVLKLIKPALVKNLEGTYKLNNFGMFKNSLKTIIRSSIKYKFYTTINILGLVIGISGSLIIWEYIKHELSYENFHVHADDIHRLTSEYGNNTGFNVHWARTPHNWVNDLVAELPEVKAHIRFQNHAPRIVKVEKKSFKEKYAFSVDSTVFDVYSLQFIHGNPKSALAEPFSVVLTESIALKYFGDKTSLGKTIQILNDGESILEDYQVTGVIEDLPTNTHLPINMLTSFRNSSERQGWAYNYLLFEKEANIESVKQKIDSLITKHAPVNENEYNKLHLQSIKDIHLHSNLAREITPNGDIFYVQIFGVVGFFIFLMAIINFTNMTSTRSLEKSKEVGVRKVLGSNRVSLFKYFLTESMFHSGISSMLALGVIFILAPNFQDISGISIEFDLYFFNILIFFMILTGLIGGIYPATIVSGLKPIHALGGSVKIKNDNAGISFKQVSVGIQFIICIAILSSAMITWKQFDFIQSKSLGYDPEQILAITNSPLGAQAGYENFKHEVKKIPGIIEVSASMQAPSTEIRDSAPIYYEGIKESEKNIVMDIQVVDTNFVDFMKMNLLAGSGFSENLRSQERPPESASLEKFHQHLRNSRREYIINETAMKQIGATSPTDVIGYQFAWMGSFALQKGPIVGVVKDFHQEALHNTIDPLVMIYEPVWLRTFLVKTEARNLQKTLSSLEDVWSEMFPDYPMESHFLDDMFHQLYQSEQRQKEILLIFSSLAILIALLGLLGLISFLIQNRIKELAIRKILGASPLSIILIFGRGFFIKACMAFFLAFPSTYYFMESWLNGFAYRISISGVEFFMAFLTLLLAISITIILRVNISSSRNPAEILRYE